MKIRTVIRKSIATLMLLPILFSSVPFATIARAEESMAMTEVSYSLDWEDYIGDIETFVYGLITNELDFTYDAFPACVELINGDSVYGIGYTDYTECYATDDEDKYCFEAGFIPFAGEPDISQEDFDEGLPLYDLNYSDDQVSFILAYGSDAFSNHCVVYGQYLKYGVDEHGRIFYNASTYVRGECDTSLGSLYSYWMLDVVFSEDDCTLQSEDAQITLNCFRKFALLLHKHYISNLSKKPSIKSNMLNCLMNDNLLLNAIS